MSNEMIKLREWLNKKQISWEDVSDVVDLELMGIPFETYRTHFKYKGHEVSVIHGFGTYGGWSFIDQQDKGLLEMMIDREEPIGYDRRESTRNMRRGSLMR